MIVIRPAQGAPRTAEYPGSPVSVATLLRQAGCSPDLPCGGQGRCGACRVYARGALSAPAARECALLTCAELRDGVRLACLAEVTGADAEILLPAAFPGVDGALRPHTPAPASDTPEAASVCAKFTDTSAPARPYRPAPWADGLGLAVDLGTTAIAGYLCNLDTGAIVAAGSTANPQSAFGADVMTRIGAAISGNGPALQACVQDAIAALAQSLLARAGYAGAPLSAAVVAGNTAMLTLLAGMDATGLSRAPFTPSCLFGKFFDAPEILPGLSPACRIYIPRCISAFVGADLVCAALSAGLCDRPAPALLCDVGTNGELALFDGSRLFVCSTAAGPALEGAAIRQGSRAVSGAIDRVWAENGQMRCHVIGGVPARSVCGSGLLDAVAAALSLGRLAPDGRIDFGTELLLADTDVCLSQADIRAVQLAKAAIRAGIDVLCRAGGQDAPEILLAGNFGSALDPESAVRTGLLPGCAAGRIRPIGNAAGDGALQLLLHEPSIRAAEAIAARAVPVPLSGDPFFSERFVARCAFPG